MKKLIAAALLICITGGSAAVVCSCTADRDAAPDTYTNSGICGEDLTWTFDGSTGILTIEGSGAMYEYPWEEMYTSESDSTGDVKQVSQGYRGKFWEGGLEAVSEVILNEGITVIDGRAFEGFTSLKEVSIPGSVTKILGKAFKSCTNLQRIDISEGVTKIGYEAFKDCTSLTEAYIPESVETIDKSAFEGCTNLQEVSVPLQAQIDPSAFLDTPFYANSNIRYQNLGKINDDNKTTVTDASDVLMECASLSKGTRTYSDEKKFKADLDFNGKITTTDASLLLRYCAYLAKGGEEKLRCIDYLASLGIKPDDEA